jgi:hypothetical protein
VMKPAELVQLLDRIRLRGTHGRSCQASASARARSSAPWPGSGRARSCRCREGPRRGTPGGSARSRSRS